MKIPSYYAIIPAFIRYSTTLTDKAKLLYGEITCLANKSGECWAGNNYFAELYSCRTETISRLVSELENEGFINVIYQKEGCKIIKRIITIDKNVNRTIDKNVKGNNTSKAIVLNKELNNSEVKTPSHNCNTLIKLFAEKWKEKNGKDYMINWGKHNKLGKKLLDTIEYVELTKLIDKYFESTDRFVLENAQSFEIFYSMINKLRVDNPCKFPDNDRDEWFKEHKAELIKAGINPFNYPVKKLYQLYERAKDMNELKSFLGGV